MNKEMRKQIKELAERDRQIIYAKQERDKNRNKGELLSIIIQAFYGNRTITEVYEDTIDYLILGYTDIPLQSNNIEKIDRTIIRIPDTDNLVLIYNKYQETEKLESKANRKPLAVIPELNINVYSRCIVCKMNTEGKLASITNEDFEKVLKYLAE